MPICTSCVRLRREKVSQQGKKKNWLVCRNCRYCSGCWHLREMICSARVLQRCLHLDVQQIWVFMRLDTCIEMPAYLTPAHTHTHTSKHSCSVSFWQGMSGRQQLRLPNYKLWSWDALGFCLSKAHPLRTLCICEMYNRHILHNCSVLFARITWNRMKVRVHLFALYVQSPSWYYRNTEYMLHMCISKGHTSGCVTWAEAWVAAQSWSFLVCIS